jgi:hypothetical protein
MTDIELAKEQHEQLMLKFNEAVAGLKALFIVPVLVFYMAGVDLAFWFERIPVSLWAAMNVMIVAPMVAMGFGLIFKRK